VKRNAQGATGEPRGRRQRGTGRTGRSATRRFAFAAALFAVGSLVLGAGVASALAPIVDSTGVSAVTTRTAVLEARVNPNGEATAYRFEYGLADCSSNPCTAIPIPDGNLGSGELPIPVANEVGGLTPDTTYHFSVVATNGSGSVVGPDRTFNTYPNAAAVDDCPNRARRLGLSAYLPDCRAYEMVSPLDKNNGDILTAPNITNYRTGVSQSAIDGGKFTYATYKTFGDAASGRYSNQYLATRTPSGWINHGISVPQGQTVFDPKFWPPFDAEVQFKAFSDDLSSAWFTDDNLNTLTADALQGYANVYRLNNLTGAYEAVTNEGPYSPAETDLGGAYVEVQGASKDAGAVVFAARAALTPDATPSETISQVYVFSGGKLRLVSVLPDGSANTGDSGAGRGTDAISGRWSTNQNAVSEDAETIFWTNGGFGSGEIYVRLNARQPQSAVVSGECTEPEKACTVEATSAPNGRYWTAAGDGSTVVYEVGGDLFEFDVETRSTTPIAPEVVGVAGSSEDASYLYFVSHAALAAGAVAGEPNLYLRHEGTLSFIDTLLSRDLASSQEGIGAVAPEAIKRTTRVTPDGRTLAFMSAQSLTGYDNTDALEPSEVDSEVFLYDADADEITCASCNPSGARPIGQKMPIPYFNLAAQPIDMRVAAWLNSSERAVYSARALSDDGNRLFFNSFDSLVPRDTNGSQDVYQWEAQGTGSCQKAGGCVSLISSGSSSGRSEFVDASADGSEVFFETSSSLVSHDPGLVDIYSARVGGGFPPPPPPANPCVGDACQTAPVPAPVPTPASASFRGQGDPSPAARTRRCRRRARQAGRAHGSKRGKANRCRRQRRRAGR
jgi:hypothetical protein